MGDVLEILSEIEKERKSAFLSPQERMRQEMMPMQQVREGEPILEERKRRYEVYGAEEEKLPEVPTKTVTEEGLAPRTAEAFGKPREEVVTADVVPRWSAFLNRILGLEQIRNQGFYQVGDETRWLTPKQKREVGEQEFQDINRFMLYTHYGPMAMRGIAEYWAPKFDKYLTSRKQEAYTKLRESDLFAEYNKTKLEDVTKTTTRLPELAGESQTYQQAYRHYLYDNYGKAHTILGELPADARVGADFYARTMEKWFGKMNFPTAQHQIISTEYAGIVSEYNKLAEQLPWRMERIIDRVVNRLGTMNVSHTVPHFSEALDLAADVMARSVTAYTGASIEELVDLSLTPDKMKSLGLRIKVEEPKRKLTPEEEREIIRKPPGKIEKEPETGPTPEIERVYPGEEPEPDIMKPRKKPTVVVPQPTEEMGGLPQVDFRAEIKPKGLATKIASLYEKIEEAGGVGRISKERTIMNMIERGQEQTARQAFREGQKQGIFKATEKFENMLQMKAERQELRDRVRKARDQIFGVDTRYLRPEYQADIRGLVDDLDNVITRRAKTLYRLQRIHDYIADNPDNNMSPDELEAARRLDKKPLGELTVDEIESIAKQVQHFAKLNELKNQLIFGRRYRQLSEAVADANQNLTKRPTRADYSEHEISVGDAEKRAGALKNIGMEYLNPEMVTNILDADATGGGIISQLMFDGVNDGMATRFTIEQQANDFKQNLWKGLGLTKQDLEKMGRGIGGNKVVLHDVKLPSGKTIKMTSGDRISFLLHAASRENVYNILENGFNFSTNIGRLPFKITKDDFRAIVQSATDVEQRIAYGIARYLNTTNKDMINAVSVDLDGYERATVDNYWTLLRSQDWISKDVSKLRRNFTNATLENMGILKERTGVSGPVVIEDAFTQFDKITTQTASYVGLAKPLRNAKMLLFDKDFKRSIVQRFGRHYWNYLDKYLRQIEDSSYRLGSVDKFVQKAVSRLDLALLGMNPGVILKQFPSWMLLMTEIEPKYVLPTIAQGVGPKTIAEIKTHSPRLRSRFEAGRVTFELGELGQIGKVRHTWLGESPLSHRVVDPIRWMDMQAVGRGWLAAKNKVNAEFPELTGDAYWAKVNEIADRIIRRTQPTWEMQDRSAIQRDPSTFVKIMTKYMSQRNKNLQIIRRAWLEYQMSPKGPDDKAKFISKFLLVTLVQSLIMEGINQMRDRFMGKKPKPLVLKLLGVVGNSIGYLYFVGDIFNSIVDKVNRGTWAGYDMSNPLFSMGESGVNAVVESIRTIEQIVSGEQYKTGKKVDERKWKSSMWRAIDNWGTFTGMWTGIPYRTARSYLKGAYDHLVPKSEDEEIDALMKTLGY